MLLPLILFSIRLKYASSLICTVNGSAADERWDDPIIANEGITLVNASNITFSYGTMKCPVGLDRCMRFEPSDISSFLQLDAAKGQSTFRDLFLNMSGTVSGYACATQRDCVEMKAANLSSCRNSTTGSCCCSSDGCTGAGRDYQMIISTLVTSMLLIISGCD